MRSCIERMKFNLLARKVKLADLRHNSDMTRLDHIGERDLQRLKKYRAAIRILENREENRK